MLCATSVRFPPPWPLSRRFPASFSLPPPPVPPSVSSSSAPCAAAICFLFIFATVRGALRRRRQPLLFLVGLVGVALTAAAATAATLCPRELALRGGSCLPRVSLPHELRRPILDSAKSLRVLQGARLPLSPFLFVLQTECHEVLS